MSGLFQRGPKAKTARAAKNTLLSVWLLLMACTPASSVATPHSQRAATATASAATDSRSSEESPPKQHRPRRGREPTPSTPYSCELEDQPPRGTFEDVSGWIAYRCGWTIVAVDPENPARSLSLGSVRGCPTGHYADGCQRADPIGWSSDGTRLLLMIVFRDGLGTDLWVMDEDGSVRRITKREDGGWGSFSPDGSKVVYGCCGDRPGPYVVHTDGGRSRSLGHPCRAPCGEPLSEAAAWSPQRSRIAWVDFEEDSAAYGHHAYVLSFVHPDGTGVRTEVAPLPGGSNLVWSPDGTRLALWHGGDDDRQGQVFIIDADGSRLRQLTRHGDNRWPAWSPDGSRLAFVHDHRLFTLAVESGDMRKVRGVRLEGPIAWSPAPSR